MTAQSSDAGSATLPGGAGRSGPRLGAVDSTGPADAAGPVGPAGPVAPTGLDETRLETFLTTAPDVWGGSAHPVRQGFAALRFDASPGSATRTRGFLRSTLTGWQLPELVDDATSVAAELVANAVTHALACATPPGPGDAWIALVKGHGAVVCAVADPSPRPPAMADPDPLAESGRGLHIVARLSERWGCSRLEASGKTVWARLASGH